MSGGLRLSAAGERQAGDEVPLLAPDVWPGKSCMGRTYILLVYPERHIILSM